MDEKLHSNGCLVCKQKKVFFSPQCGKDQARIETGLILYHKV